MNELSTTLGGIFSFLPEIARTQLEDSGLIRAQQPPVTERPVGSTVLSRLPAWLLPVSAVAGVLVLVLLLRRK